MSQPQTGPDGEAITSLTTPLPEWSTPSVQEIQVSATERAELERLADLQQLECNQQSNNKPVSDYGVALGLMSPVVSWRGH
jgi:hypothetical protein